MLIYSLRVDTIIGISLTLGNRSFVWRAAMPFRPTSKIDTMNSDTRIPDRIGMLNSGTFCDFPACEEQQHEHRAGQHGESTSD